jgi:hypothetical protein
MKMWLVAHTAGGPLEAATPPSPDGDRVPPFAVWCLVPALGAAPLAFLVTTSEPASRGPVAPRHMCACQGLRTARGLPPAGTWLLMRVRGHVVDMAPYHRARTLLWKVVSVLALAMSFPHAIRAAFLLGVLAGELSSDMHLE